MKNLAKHWLFLIGLVLFLVGITLNLFWQVNYAKDLNFSTYDGWSPTNEKLIFASVSGDSWLYASFESFHVLDIQNKDFWNIDTIYYAPVWSPDGESLTFLGDASIRPNLTVIDKNGANPRVVYTCVLQCEKFYWMSTGEGIWIKECPKGIPCSGIHKVYKIIQPDTRHVIEEDVPTSLENGENLTVYLFLAFLQSLLRSEPLEVCPNHHALTTGRGNRESFSADRQYFTYNLPDGSFNIVETQSCKTIFTMDEDAYFASRWWHLPAIIRYGSLLLGQLIIVIARLRTRFIS